ncbi:hypothetical protein LXL04_037798 [Taraxacum kok-saghyz]
MISLIMHPSIPQMPLIFTLGDLELLLKKYL